MTVINEGNCFAPCAIDDPYHLLRKAQRGAAHPTQPPHNGTPLGQHAVRPGMMTSCGRLRPPGGVLVREIFLPILPPLCLILWRRDQGRSMSPNHINALSHWFLRRDAPDHPGGGECGGCPPAFHHPKYIAGAPQDGAGGDPHHPPPPALLAEVEDRGMHGGPCSFAAPSRCCAPP